MNAVSIIVLAFGDEPYLGDCLAALLAGAHPDTQILLVDNGAQAAVAALPPHDRVVVIQPGQNLGFAGGCDEAARRADGEVLVLVNSDAVVAPGAVDRLVGALDDPTLAVVSGGVRLADRPDLMNSVGNPVHYLGVVWAGGYGEPAAAHDVPRDVASASGAFLAIRRDRWMELGGFAQEFFAYHEDTDLSLRAWQRGWRVGFVPAAVVWHHYEFSRNPGKQYLLERNRWLTVLTVYPAPVLAAVLPAMLAFEVAISAVAAMQGWLPQKLRGWVWLIRRAGWIRDRRTEVQRERVMSSRDFAGLLSARIEPAMIERPPGLAVLNVVLAAYWSSVRRLIRG